MSSETSIPGGRPFPSLRELTGTVIDGRYEVGRLLGCGGMGAVYEAMQLRLDRRVAIKILNPVYMHRDDYVTRFMREAKAASRIRHENVVQVLDFGELASGSVYSVMEFLEGRDLAQLLQLETKLPWPRTRDLLLQMSRGLKAAHAEGVIHRDIKPANLFLVPDPEENRDILKVLDFGIARLQTSTSHTAGLTGTAELLGTPSYMAPELARGRAANPRSEVYSVGVVAYRMVTGHLPFEGQTAFDVLFRSATEPAPPLRTHDPTVPPAIEALVLRMLAKDPEERFPDMGTLYREVASIDEHGRPQRTAVLATGPQTTLEAPPIAAAPTPGPATVVDAGAPAPSPAPASVPTAPSMPIGTAPAMGPMLREHTLVSTEPGGGPAVVVPPPLSVSASTRAALAATRAARAAASGVAHRLDPPTGSGARAMPHAASESGSGPIGLGPHVTPDPRGGDPTHPMPGAEATPAPGSSAASHLREGATIPVTDVHLHPDSASGHVPFLPSASGTAAVPSSTHDLHELRAIQGAKVPRWLVGTVFGVVAVVGIIAIAATRGDDAPTPEPAAPTVIAAPSVIPDDDDRSTPAAASLTGSTPAAEGASADAPPEPEPAPEPQPQPSMVIEDEPEPPAEPEPAKPEPSSRPPASRPSAPHPAAPKPEPEPRAKPKSEPTPDKAPSDASIVKRLQRQAERKCGMLLGGEPLTVKFGIGKDGKVLAPRASRSGAAAKCVLGVLDGAEFPPGKMRAEDLKL